MKKNILHISLFIAAVLVLFFLQLLLQKGTTLELETNSNSLHPKIYFQTIHDKFYSEQNSLNPTVSKVSENGRYSFDLRNMKEFTKLRVDPDTRPGSVQVKSMEIIQKDWFHTRYFSLSLKSITPLNQIKNFTIVGDGISFKSTGNDPNLEIAFQPVKELTTTNYHIQELLIALIGALIGVFLQNLYKNYEHSQTFYAKLILYALFFSFTIFKVEYYKEHINFGYPPDELAHLSYVEYVHNHHHFMPDYNQMRMINNKSAYNYLSHPPLYYEIMNLAYDNSKDIRDNGTNFRNLSSLLFLLSVMIILFIGFRARFSIVADLVFLSIFTAVPMHAYIGASVSNDTLALLGGAIFAAGFLKLLERDYSFLSYFLLALGIVVAYFAKLTAALLIFFALLVYLLQMVVKKEKIAFGKKEVALFAIILAPILYYQLSIIYHYHAIVPTFDKTHPHEYLLSNFYIPPEHRQHLNLSEWFERLLGYIQGGWFGIHSHHSFTKESWFGSIGLLLLHIFAFIALFLKCPQEKSAFCRLGKITLMALLMVLTVQFFFSYRAHLSSGYMGGLQPRYLLPFMFAFAIMGALFVERFVKSFWAVVVVILLSFHALYSDFFYFLQYYQ